MESVAGLNRRALERVRLSRDARFDGKIFVAVSSTHIYCRPICPSPTSRPKNVHYYATATEAAAAGYRPCLRCRPEAAPGSPAWLGTSAVVRRALRLIRDGALDDESVDELAERLGVGARHLTRLFARHVGASPIAIAQTRRLQFAKRLLDDTDLSITQIALAAGYGSVRRFNHCFLDVYGRAPRDLRKRRAVTRRADRVMLRLSYRPPFDWRHALDFLAARAIAGVEHVDADSYSRLVRVGESVASIRVTHAASHRCLELWVSDVEPGALFGIVDNAKRMFDVAADPGQTREALSVDAQLGALLRRWPGTRIIGAWDPFECAVRAAVEQPANAAAANPVLARITRVAGLRCPDIAPGLTHLFPTPDELLRASGRSLGLTTSRLATLHALARAVRDGSIDWRASADEVTTALAAVPGFGTWAAQYVTLRALGKPDSFPLEDVALRRGLNEAAAPMSTLQLGRRSESWRPWRGYAAMLGWRAGEHSPRGR